MENNLKQVNFEFFAHDSCPVCQGRVMVPNGRINWLGIDFWYVVCTRCGLKFMNPMPTQESYQEFYKSKFWQQKIRNLGYHQPGQVWQKGKYKFDNEEVWDADEGRQNRIAKHREQRPKTIIPVLEKLIKLDQNSKILEVGCGYGVTLDEIYKKFKCQVFGIEPSDDSKEIIKDYGYIEFLGRYVEDLEKISQNPDLKFDAIIFSHALENIVNPLKIIKLAKDCLKPDGIIYVQTPNLLVNDQMNPYHPYIFSDYSLRVLAKMTGLKYKKFSKTIERMLIVCFK